MWPLSSWNDTRFLPQKSPRTHLGTPCLAKALFLTQNGWPINHCTDPELKPYFTRRHELSVEQGCLMWGLSSVPPSLRQTILTELHEGHPGIAHEINSPQSFLVAENRSGDWNGYPWMSTVQQNPQGSSSLTASSMVLADSSMATCSRRFCHPSGKTIAHHGRRPL